MSEIQVRGGTITSPSPYMYFKANIVNSLAEAPELTNKLCFTPTHSDHCFSNSTTLGPLVSLGIGS